MKTVVLLAISLLVVSSVTVCAQDCRHEVSMGVGLATFPDIASTFAMVFELGLSMGNLHEEWESSTLPFTVFYRYHGSRLISVGGNFVYQKFERKLYVQDEIWSTSSINYYTLMGRIDFNYVRTRLLRMYSGVALGFYHSSESGGEVKESGETKVALQVNAVGLRVGKQLAGYLELGFGFNGVLATGIAYEF